MRYLFSTEGRRALKTLVKKPVLYAFDLGGTLAPLASHRDAIKIPLEIDTLIRELATSTPCAIVSGRSLQELTSRLNGMVPHFLGNHGLESAFASVHTLHEAEEVCREWIHIIGTDVTTLKAGGLELEDKTYSLTFHYSRVNDPEEMRIELMRLLKTLRPKPRILFGKMAINVLPPGYRGKGPAVLSLATHLGLQGIFYIGDEEADESVFELQNRLTMGVRVGRNHASRAHYYVSHQAEVEDILRFFVNERDHAALAD